MPPGSWWLRGEHAPRLAPGDRRSGSARNGDHRVGDMTCLAEDGRPRYRTCHDSSISPYGRRDLRHHVLAILRRKFEFVEVDACGRLGAIAILQVLNHSFRRRFTVPPFSEPQTYLSHSTSTDDSPAHISVRRARDFLQWGLMRKVQRGQCWKPCAPRSGPRSHHLNRAVQFARVRPGCAVKRTGSQARSLIAEEAR